MSSTSHHTATSTVDLSVEQTVPKALVHKRWLENVLLTDIKACDGDTFVCAGRIPTMHWFLNDGVRNPRTDILFYTELGRQASLAICHAFLNVAADEVFIFEGSQATVTTLDSEERVESPADAVLVEVRVRETLGAATTP